MDLISPLISALKDANQEVRVVVIAALAGYRDPATIQALIPTVQPPSEELKK